MKQRTNTIFTNVPPDMRIQQLSSLRMATLVPLVIAMLLSEPYPARSQHADSIPPAVFDRARYAVTNAANNFGFDLFRQIAQEPGTSTNLCLSPFSVAQALSMILNGAKGETRSQMEEAMRLTDIDYDAINAGYGVAGGDVIRPDSLQWINDFNAIVSNDITSAKEITVNNANSLWVREGVEIYEEFQRTLQGRYNAEVRNLNFNSGAASDTINRWVSEQTHGLIESIVPSAIPPMTMMYVINALYFKGLWELAFDKNDTEREEFTLSSGRTIRHDMMNIHSAFRYAEFPGIGQVVQLPYKAEGQAIVMVVILPPKRATTLETINALTGDSFERLNSKLTMREGYVRLPKFTLNCDMLLNEPLASLGMILPLNPYGGADFSGISDTPLFMSKVRQKVFVEVNEEGTEAAAVTVISMDLSTSAGPSSQPEPFRMNVDRPFLFAIYSRTTRSVLFLGRVENPAVES